MQRRSQRGEILECIPELGAIERANSRAARERRAKEQEDRLRQAEMGDQINNNQQPEIAEGQHPNGGANVIGAQPQAPGARRPVGRPIGAFDEPNLREVRHGIPTPAIKANNIEVKSSLITMAQNQRYNGLPLEDPLDHLDQFERLCRTVKMNGVPEDAIKMILFPFSLGNKASQWEKNVPSELVSTWDSVKKEFISKFYPKQKTAKLRNDITSFKQGGHENLYEAWDRLKDYIRRCPHHGVSKENLLGIFYRGALEQYRRALDTASYGCFSNLTVEQGELLIENLAQSEACYSGDYDRSAHGQSQDSQQQIKELNEKVEKLSRIFLVNQKAVNFVGEAEADQQGYAEVACDGFQGVQEEVNYVGNQNNYQGGFQNRPYNQSYGNNNLSYRSNNVENPQDQYYPPRAPQGNSYQPRPSGGSSQPYNAPWKFQGVQNSAPAIGYQGDQKYRPPQQRQDAYPAAHSTGQDDVRIMIKQLMEGQVKAQAQLNEKLEKFERKIDSNHAESQAKFADIYSHLKTLDNQIAQVASSSKRPMGTLPGKPEQNPKEYCSAITLRISNDYSERTMAEREIESEVDDEEAEAESESSVETDPSEDEGEEQEVDSEESAELTPPAPEPQLQSPERCEEELTERHKALLETLLAKIKFDDPLIKSFLEHPKWPEPLKNALRKKGRELGTAEMLSRRRCAITQMKLITDQERDPGRFTLPCIIGFTSFPRCLCDLGASTSVMPLTTARKLGFKRFKRCDFDLVLADRSTRRPEGLLEGVPIKIKDFMITTDFVVLKMDEETRDPLIFGRPFLATTKAIIDVIEKSIYLRLGNEVLRFRVEAESGRSGQVLSVEALDVLEESKTTEADDKGGQETLDTLKERKRGRTPEQEDGTRKASRVIPGMQKDRDANPAGEKTLISLHCPPSA